MIYNRRKFIYHAGAITTASLILPGCISKTEKTSEAGADEFTGGGLEEFGIQLYTLRDDMPDDPQGILRQLAGFGFKQIEGYEGPQGMFWNMGHMGFKNYLDELGMTMVASHCNINEDFETKASQAAEIGMEYLICPYVGPQESMDQWKAIADQFNACGEICNQNGIRFAYHNHAYSFQEFEGIIPQDYLMENTDPSLVDHQMDIYWVVTGQADPVAYLEKYPGRFTLCHVKDRMKTATADEREASCNLGTGSIDFPRILTIAKENGMKYYILEQERYDNSTPLDSAKAGAEYLKSFQFIS